MKKFSIGTASEPLEFEVGDDKFTAVPANRLPGSVLISYVEDVQAGQVYKAHKNLFSKALTKESKDLFLERLDSTENPITLEVMVSIAEWLTESYSAFTNRGAS